MLQFKMQEICEKYVLQKSKQQRSKRQIPQNRRILEWKGCNLKNRLKGINLKMATKIQENIKIIELHLLSCLVYMYLSGLDTVLDRFL